MPTDREISMKYHNILSWYLSVWYPHICSVWTTGSTEYNLLAPAIQIGEIFKKLAIFTSTVDINGKSWKEK